MFLDAKIVGFSPQKGAWAEMGGEKAFFPPVFPYFGVFGVGGGGDGVRALFPPCCLINALLFNFCMCQKDPGTKGRDMILVRRGGG